MKCRRCQRENPADAVFCQECGSRLEGACPGCGTASRLDAKFCKTCGQPVAGRPPPEGARVAYAPEARSRSEVQYVSCGGIASRDLRHGHD